MSIQTYKGYFQNGLFMPFEPVSIPENTTVYVVIDDEPVFVNIKKKKQSDRSTPTGRQQLAALERLLAASREIDDEPLDEEFDKILAQGVHCTGVLDL